MGVPCHERMCSTTLGTSRDCRTFRLYEGARLPTYKPTSTVSVWLLMRSARYVGLKIWKKDYLQNCPELDNLSEDIYTYCWRNRASTVHMWLNCLGWVKARCECFYSRSI
ncbi:hypothetical protein NPIL_128421 [Nephila pilipes]|uniref:Uncharacterized protein n=1 Tax=Nephila pilipes TaxID=299642 RepID=A0A8X6ICN3_NEPPI|nr:hypothetical protein NPIL_128421 [Nephila pilipes]